MRSPPKPSQRTPGHCSLSASMRFAPCRSPLGSPALKKIVGALAGSATTASLRSVVREWIESAGEGNRKWDTVATASCDRRRRVGRQECLPHPCAGGADIPVCPPLLLLLASESGRNGQARQGGCRFDATIAEGPQYFEDLAPGREGAAVGALVEVHRLHEGDLLIGVVAFAGGRIDLPATFALLATVLAAAPLDRHRDVALAAVIVSAAVVAAAVGDDEVARRGLLVAHGTVPL